MVLVSGRFLPTPLVVSTSVERHNPCQQPKNTTGSHLAPTQLKLYLQHCSRVLPTGEQPQLLEVHPIIPREGPPWTACASRRSIRACRGWQGRMGSRALSCPADKGARTCQITQVGGGWREVVHAQNLLLKWKQNQKPDRAEVILVEFPLLFSSFSKSVSVCSRFV